MADTILLIEDDEAARYLTQKVLTRCGFTGQIDIVCDGKEAIDYLAQEGIFAGRPPETRH